MGVVLFKNSYDLRATRLTEIRLVAGVKVSLFSVLTQYQTLLSSLHLSKTGTIVPKLCFSVVLLFYWGLWVCSRNPSRGNMV